MRTNNNSLIIYERNLQTIAKNDPRNQARDVLNLIFTFEHKQYKTVCH